jgi:hypothetical protein
MLGYYLKYRQLPWQLTSKLANPADNR